MWALYIVVILWKIKRCGDEIRILWGCSSMINWEDVDDGRVILILISTA